MMTDRIEHHNKEGAGSSAPMGSAGAANMPAGWPLVLTVLWITLFPFSATAQHAHSQLSAHEKAIKSLSMEAVSGLLNGTPAGPVFFNVWTDVGLVAEPYVSSCSSDERPVLGLETAMGTRLSGGLAVSLRASVLREAGTRACPLAVPSRTDGTYRVRKFPDPEDDGLATTGIHAGSALGAIPFLHVSGGAGVEWTRMAPYVAGGVSLRFGSDRFRFLLGGQYMLLRTPYLDLQREWRNGRIIREDRIVNGHEWKRGVLLRLGLQVRADAEN